MPTVLSLPDVGIEQVSFDLVVPRSVGRMGGRRTEARLFGTPYWSAEYRTTFLKRSETGKVERFIRRLLSRGDVFLGWDRLRPRPLDHDDGSPLSGTVAVGGGAFTGIAALDHINDTHTVVIDGLPANFQLREGDYIEFRMTSLVRSLHSIESDVQANSSGVVTLSIDPALDTDNFDTTAVVNFEKPSCIMQPSDWSAQKSWSSRNPAWSAQEVFYYEP